MNNKTTPAWAIKAAVEIVNTVDANPAYNFPAKNVTASNMARIIGERAPDAEALAVALDECLGQIRHAYYCSGYEDTCTCGCYKAGKNASNVLLDYRARLPLVAPAPVAGVAADVALVE